MNYKTPIVLIFVIFSVFVSSYAHADKYDGLPGPILSLELVATSSSHFDEFHGSVRLDTAFGIDRYKWGGTSCPGKDLGDYRSHNQHLLDALIQYSQNQDMCVKPFYKNGQGGALCLVGIRAKLCETPE